MHILQCCTNADSLSDNLVGRLTDVSEVAIRTCTVEAANIVEPPPLTVFTSHYTSSQY